MKYVIETQKNTLVIEKMDHTRDYTACINCTIFGLNGVKIGQTFETDNHESAFAWFRLMAGSYPYYYNNDEVHMNGHFTVGKKYVHRYFVDVYVEILSVSSTNEGSTITVLYWNKSASRKSPYLIENVKHSIKISKDLYVNWSEYE